MLTGAEVLHFLQPLQAQQRSDLSRGEWVGDPPSVGTHVFSGEQ